MMKTLVVILFCGGIAVAQGADKEEREAKQALDKLGKKMDDSGGAYLCMGDSKTPPFKVDNRRIDQFVASQKALLASYQKAAPAKSEAEFDRQSEAMQLKALRAANLKTEQGGYLWCMIGTLVMADVGTGTLGIKADDDMRAMGESMKKAGLGKQEDLDQRFKKTRAAQSRAFGKESVDSVLARKKELAQLMQQVGDAERRLKPADKAAGPPAEGEDAGSPDAPPPSPDDSSAE